MTETFALDVVIAFLQGIEQAVLHTGYEIGPAALGGGDEFDLQRRNHQHRIGKGSHQGKGDYIREGFNEIPEIACDYAGHREEHRTDCNRSHKHRHKQFLGTRTGCIHS